MRSQRSLGFVAALGVITCICAFHTTAAIDIPLEGECSFVFVSVSVKVRAVHLINKKDSQYDIFQSNK